MDGNTPAPPYHMLLIEWFWICLSAIVSLLSITLYIKTRNLQHQCIEHQKRSTTQEQELQRLEDAKQKLEESLKQEKQKLNDLQGDHELLDDEYRHVLDRFKLLELQKKATDEQCELLKSAKQTLDERIESLRHDNHVLRSQIANPQGTKHISEKNPPTPTVTPPINGFAVIVDDYQGTSKNLKS